MARARSRCGSRTADLPQRPGDDRQRLGIFQPYPLVPAMRWSAMSRQSVPKSRVWRSARASESAGTPARAATVSGATAARIAVCTGTGFDRQSSRRLGRSVRVNWKFAIPLPDAIESAWRDRSCGRAHGLHADGRVWRQALDANRRDRNWWTRPPGSSIPGRDGLRSDGDLLIHSKDDLARKLGATRFIASRSKRRIEEGRRVVRLHHVDRGRRPSMDRLCRRPSTAGPTCIRGNSGFSVAVPVFGMVLEKSVSGGCCGVRSDTARMLEFAGGPASGR